MTDHTIQDDEYTRAVEVMAENVDEPITLQDEVPMTNLQRVRQAKAADNERRSQLFVDAVAIDQQREEAARPYPALMQRLGQLQSQASRLSAEAAELRQGLATAALLAEAGVETDTGAETARLDVLADQLKPVTADIGKIQTRIDEIGALMDDLGRRAADIREHANFINPDLCREERAALIEEIAKKRLAFIKVLSAAATYNSQWSTDFYNGKVDGMRHNRQLDEIAQMTPPHLRNLQPIPAPDMSYFTNASMSQLTHSHGTYDYEAECRALGIRLEDLE